MTEPREKPGFGKGVLRRTKGLEKFGGGRFHPPESLAPFVEHFWTTHWDLRGEPVSRASASLVSRVGVGHGGNMPETGTDVLKKRVTGDAQIFVRDRSGSTGLYRGVKTTNTTCWPHAEYGGVK